jgi:serine protease Do
MTWGSIAVWMAACAVLLQGLTSSRAATENLGLLPSHRSRSGALLLNAFAPATLQVRESVVLLEVKGRHAALGTVIDSSGLVLTKASEIADAELTCKLANEHRTTARVLAIDEESDLALVKVEASGLKPVSWSSATAVVGQWAITPGLESAPEAIGIVSVASRKILPKQAMIGVQLDFQAEDARIAEILPGMGAEKAGLKSGDVILEVNDSAVGNADALVNALRHFREGQTIKMCVRRDSDPFEIEVTMMAPKVERGRRGRDRFERMNQLGGDLSRRAEGFELAIQHDTVLQPWQCGGPLLDLQGQAIGLNIARAGRVASYALPAATVMQIAERLKRESQVPVAAKPSS